MCGGKTRNYRQTARRKTSGIADTTKRERENLLTDEFKSNPGFEASHRNDMERENKGIERGFDRGFHRN